MPPSPQPPEEHTHPPQTPTKRKASQPNTPRRATAVKRTNAPSPKIPIRKASGNVIKTPDTAPARTKTGNSKKSESTLLGDFLLGRPSPARQRRKSLDVVRQELKEANVGSIKVPGGVKDRVKQWQKASSSTAVIVEDPNVGSDENATQGRDKEEEGVEDGSVDEEERLRIKFRGAKRPGRRKSREQEQDEDESEDKSRSRSAPRKRVISDHHWMKPKAPKNSPPNKRNGSQKIPKDFLLKTTVKEPLGQRVQDWIKISEGQEPGEKVTKPKGRKSSRQEPKSSKEDLTDAGAQVRRRSNSIDIGFRINPKDEGSRKKSPEDSPKESSVGDGLRVKPVCKDGSKRRPKEPEEDEIQTPTRRSEKHLRPSADFTSKSQASSHGSKRLEEEDDTFSYMTPSPPEHSKRKTRKSETPSELSEIPFGNSAFSVLDMPVGAEAGTTKRPPPKRAASFGVPKVLKKVYNAVHDGPEPVRTGPNQPASIESWLNGTSDPFVDRPTPPQSVVDVTDGVPSRNASYKAGDQTERELTADHQSEHNSRRKRRVRKSLQQNEPESRPQEDATPLETPKARDALPKMEHSSSISPTGLKRSSATRNTSSPKAARKSMLKDAIFDAFKGESAMAGQNNSPSPFAEITGLRERDINRAPDFRPSSRDQSYDADDTPPKRSPRPPEKVSFDEPSRQRDKPLPVFLRGPPPTTGGHRLSTIASVETFSSSSRTETASNLSQTTITQDTVLTQTTAPSISRKSNKPSKLGLKRRLTKHSDLISVLSLPDSAQPGSSKSIRSARSVRTTRSHLDTATVYDLMREVAEDEAKYMRELKTLVDGVIPVLLTCVLSKSDSAIAAGFFNPNSTSGTDAAFTKPIVDMGVALERLNSLHKRIPLEDADAFIAWSIQANKIYQDYLAAWRTGFQDVVVNLASASRSASAEESTLDEMPRNAHGDVVGSNGERVDVAYLLKRPLVRVKYLCKAVKGLEMLRPTEERIKAREMWESSERYTRIRVKEEAARLVDQSANSIDATRARDPQTLAPIENVKINQTRQVWAKDYFALDLSHSNGQRLECRVEMLIRDKASDPTDGDVFICEVNEIRRFLLFPPISKDLISARIGDHKDQVVVMIRGVHDTTDWHETLLLEAEHEEAAVDWVDMLGTVPIPPQLPRKDVDLGEMSNLTVSRFGGKDVVSPTVDGDIPIGERRRKEAEETTTPRRERQRSSRHSRTVSTLPESIKEESTVSEPSITDLNDAMDKAGSPLTPIKRPRAARYHGRTKSTSAGFVAEMFGALDPYPEEISVSPEPVKDVDNRAGSPESSAHTVGLPFIPKRRNNSAPTTPDKAKFSTPLKESMRPEPDVLQKHQPTTPPRDDGAPPPPPHRTPTPTGLKNVPVLDTPTPRAKARRSSSPLKHEYQPSDASGTSSSSEESDSQSDSYTESSDEDELEADEMPSALPALPSYNHKRVSPNGSMYSFPNTSLAPSNSASQGPYRGVPAQRSPAVTRKNTATVSGWSDEKGRWIDLHPEPCSIVITPGLIEVFELDATHSSPNRDQIANAPDSKETLVNRPLLGQVITPIVPLRQSNAVDIEITSRATADSRIAKSKQYRIIRYRTSTNFDCQVLYRAVHESRLANPVFKKLEEERRVNGFGGNNFSMGGHERRRSWMFGRRKSYRASTRAPSEAAESEQSGKSHSSAFSALRRMSGGSMFNIAKSSIDRGSAANSTYTSNHSDWSGPTPPRTPTSPSLMGSSYSNGVVKNLGSENLKIRLYVLEPGGKWNDLGAARLTVTLPPQGMRQASTLYHGIERRIIVTHKAPTPFFNLGDKNSTKTDEERDNIILMDVVLGAACFTKIGRTGVAVNVWEDIVGDNGEVGTVGAVGGVSGRTRKWLFQTGCAPDANWIYSLVSVGR